MIEFLEDMAKVNALSQALLADKRSWKSEYSQDISKQMVGLHLAAYFRVQEVGTYPPSTLGVCGRK